MLLLLKSWTTPLPARSLRLLDEVLIVLMWCSRGRMWSFAHAISTVISRLLHAEPYPDRADVLLTLRSTISIFNDLITRKQTRFVTIKWVEATAEPTKLQQLKSV